MTGDVFADVEIPGVEEAEGDQRHLAMLVSHPCSMREGAVLNVAVQVIRVVKASVIELSDWKRHYDRLPLPNMMNVSGDDRFLDADDSYAALFDLRGRVATKALRLEQRRACLSDEGIGFLHQRMGHADTRYAPRVDHLMISCALPFVETELEEEWNSTIPGVTEAEPEKREEMLRVSAKEFDEVLSESRDAPAGPGKKSTKYRLRDDLGSVRKRTGARKEIMAMIKARRLATATVDK
jgi:hypothetical protein